jgi:hypothetical protein
VFCSLGPTIHLQQPARPFHSHRLALQKPRITRKPSPQMTLFVVMLRIVLSILAAVGRFIVERNRTVKDEWRMSRAESAASLRLLLHFSLKHVGTNLCHTTIRNAKPARSRDGKVEHPTVDSRPAIRNTNDDRFAGCQRSDANPCAEGQTAMSSGQSIPIESFTASGFS